MMTCHVNAWYCILHPHVLQLEEVDDLLLEPVWQAVPLTRLPGLHQFGLGARMAGQRLQDG